MSSWKNWLKGVVDARSSGQALLVTGSARMETWRQTGDSWPGVTCPGACIPSPVREWCGNRAARPRKPWPGSPRTRRLSEPCLAETNEDAERWRRQYFTDLIREDVLEFSRLHEINTVRLFVELLRERVGSPLSAGLHRPRSGRVSDHPETLSGHPSGALHRLRRAALASQCRPRPAPDAEDLFLRYRPGARRRRRSLGERRGVLQKPCISSRTPMARMRGSTTTKDGAEVDFALSDGEALANLIECKVADAKPHRA
ncbi:MAG: hypothetical protein IPJ52_04440 [Rhodocyclaceae bacterium]|nr:hypothetical protein [Rhodocyclaceae bacterium]